MQVELLLDDLSQRSGAGFLERFSVRNQTLPSLIIFE